MRHYCFPPHLSIWTFKEDHWNHCWCKSWFNIVPYILTIYYIYMTKISYLFFFQNLISLHLPAYSDSSEYQQLYSAITSIKFGEDGRANSIIVYFHAMSYYAKFVLPRDLDLIARGFDYDLRITGDVVVQNPVLDQLFADEIIGHGVNSPWVSHVTMGMVYPCQQNDYICRSFLINYWSAGKYWIFVLYKYCLCCVKQPYLFLCLAIFSYIK